MNDTHDTEPVSQDTAPMPEAGIAPPPRPAPAPTRPPLQRSRTDRVLGGVCGGLARYFDIDATLVRVLFVVLTIFTGGLFLLVWLVLLLVVPEEPAYPVVAAAPVPQPAYAGGAPAYPTGYTAGYAAGGTGQYVDPATGHAYGPPVQLAVDPPPRRPRSYLGLVTVSAAAIVGGLLALAAALGADLPAVVVLAAALGVLGLGLVVGAWWGRARWLVVLALVLLLVTGGASAAHRVGPFTPVGDRAWTPTATADGASYELGTGNARLDLARLSGTGRTVGLHARVGAGELRVLVPTDVRLVLHGRVGIGRVSVVGGPDRDGFDTTVETTLEPIGAPASVTTINLDAEVGVGNLEVRRAAS